jgi:transposase
MQDRLYPISKELFDKEILPIIIKETTTRGGRPPKISHYTCFCAMLKMLSCSMPWRDCPKEYGPRHTIYTRFKGIVQVCITGAGVHDSKPVQEMLYSLNLKEIRMFVADKAYDTNNIRNFLKHNKIETCIPNKGGRKEKHSFDRTTYKWRHRVENLFQRIKENRRLAMRYEKLDSTFCGFLALDLLKLEVC